MNQSAVQDTYSNPEEEDMVFISNNPRIEKKISAECSLSSNNSLTINTIQSKVSFSHSPFKCMHTHTQIYTCVYMQVCVIYQYTVFKISFLNAYVARNTYFFFILMLQLT